MLLLVNLFISVTDVSARFLVIPTQYRELSKHTTWTAWFCGIKTIIWFLFYRYPLLNKQKYMQFIGVTDTCANFLVIQKHPRSSVSTIQTKSTITAPKTRATKLQQEKTRKSAMLPQATKTKYTHPFIPHKNSRMQVEEEEHLSPSAISLNQPPAGPRNLLLNSAQPPLGRLHFYIITIHHYYQNCGTERQ